MESPEYDPLNYVTINDVRDDIGPSILLDLTLNKIPAPLTGYGSPQLMHKYCDITQLLSVTVEASNTDQQKYKNPLERNCCVNESTHTGDHSSVVTIFILCTIKFTAFDK